MMCSRQDAFFVASSTAAFNAAAKPVLSCARQRASSNRPWPIRSRADLPGPADRPAVLPCSRGEKGGGDLEVGSGSACFTRIVTFSADANGSSVASGAQRSVGFSQFPRVPASEGGDGDPYGKRSLGYPVTDICGFQQQLRPLFVRTDCTRAAPCRIDVRLLVNRPPRAATTRLCRRRMGEGATGSSCPPTWPFTRAKIQHALGYVNRCVRCDPFSAIQRRQDGTRHRPFVNVSRRTTQAGAWTDLYWRFMLGSYRVQRCG